DVELGVIAARTPGFAGADLANLVNEAAILAARDGRQAVGMGDFSRAIDRVVAGLERKSRIIGDEERRRVAYHEVGHALATTLAGGEEAIHKISIVPRGMGALGFTMQLPTEEKYLMTESAIRAKLVGLLGGRAAEQVVFGDPSTGAQDDLRKATDIARAMVTEYGMSEAIGPVSVGADRRPLFVPGGGLSGLGREPGSKLQDAVDAEVRRIVEQALEAALGLLASQRPTLERITAALIEAEVLEGDVLAELLGQARAPAPSGPAQSLEAVP
ncbi:MAG: ATP-dependent metallopeptidase FtsH/Yme1/Tma family protein, partial [Myxococcales bacterium]|nr:ATP-dependent metallopeptidase FtsH/Yme1/Tma family protein [Myxococcales bacterium]